MMGNLANPSFLDCSPTRTTRATSGRSPTKPTPTCRRQPQPSTPPTPNPNPNTTTLSWLPGQHLSACSCPNSSQPGRSPSMGHGAPEIDIFEIEKIKSTQRAKSLLKARNSHHSCTIAFMATKGSAVQQAVSSLAGCQVICSKGAEQFFIPWVRRAACTYLYADHSLGSEYWVDLSNRPNNATTLSTAKLTSPQLTDSE